MTSPIVALRDYLLPKTLEHAAKNSPFWAERLGDAWSEVKTTADLPKLPVLEKTTAVEHQRRMRCGPGAADFGSVSSGTTRIGKNLLRVQRVPEELHALEEFHQMLADGRPPAEGEAAEPPVVLHIFTPNHGVPAGEPATNTIRLAWAHSRHLFDMVESALTEEVAGQRPSVIRASVSVMKQLTVWFETQGPAPSSFGVEHIGTNAGLVSARWRRLLEDAWGAHVWDNYSLSEFVTPATECEACGGYHFSEPPLIWEVTDPAGHAPVSEGGVGQLLVTGLYPYVQRQPLIRYATGDLVQVLPFCELAGEPGFRFRGRMHHSLLDTHADRGRCLLLSGALEDLADAEPTVARLGHTSETLGLLPQGSIGAPKVRAEREGNNLHVVVGTTFAPHLFRAQAADLTARLHAALLDTHPDLVAAINNAELTLTVDLIHSPHNNNNNNNNNNNSNNDDDGPGWFTKHLM